MKSFEEYPIVSLNLKSSSENNPAALPENAVEVRSRGEWRSWLEENHTRTDAIWLITFKKRPGAPYVAYRDIVREALCFGWIDSLPRKLDAQRTMLRLSPRRPGSGWSLVNKGHIRELLECGLMHPAGLAKIEAARSDGSWEKLDSAGNLEIPPDLASELSKHPGSAENFSAIAKSTRRGILERISDAKTDATRLKRIHEAVRLAAGDQTND